MATELTTDPRLAYLQGLLTSADAARELRLSQDRVLRLLEARELGGVRVANRWLLSVSDLAAFRERRHGETSALCATALAEPLLRLTEKQRRICETLRQGMAMTAAARVLDLPRPSLYAQLKLIRKKLARIRPEFAEREAAGSR
jgi:excisionase family DNA binding protein